MDNKDLLLLSCCAPCSCAVIKKLALEKASFTVLFYNPNISCAEEYQKRLAENKRVCQKFGIPFKELDYEPAVWQAAVSGLEQEPERGKRCYECFLLRLKKTALFAKENGFKKFSSVLGISRYKDLAQVNGAALAASAIYGIDYDDTNWRKGGLEDSRRELIKELSLYSQDYCGCVYSKNKSKHT